MKIDINEIDIDSVFIPGNYVICDTLEQFEFMCILGHQLKYKWRNGNPFTKKPLDSFGKSPKGINIIEGTIVTTFTTTNSRFEDIVPLSYFEYWKRESQQETINSSIRLMEAITGKSVDDLPTFVGSMLETMRRI